jgi:hypothetical protein
MRRLPGGTIGPADSTCGRTARPESGFLRSQTLAFRETERYNSLDSSPNDLWGSRNPDSTPGARTTLSFYPGPHLEKEQDMNAFMDFMSSTYTMIGMGVILLGLIGLLIYLRTRPNEDE